MRIIIVTGFAAIMAVVFSNGSANAVFGGATDTVGPIANAVVRVNGTAGCTGALIEPDTVLTAAHCIGGGARQLPSPGQNGDLN